MLTNCLTKKGASEANLMEVMESGRFKIPDDALNLEF